MKKGIIVAALVTMFAWAVNDFINKHEVNTNLTNDVTNATNDKGGVTTFAPIGLEVGNIAPDFELKTLDGKVVKLSDYRGKGVMLNFWASWCPPCRAEMPDMQKFYETHDAPIIAVNLTQTEVKRSDVQKFVDERGLTFQVLLDEEFEVGTRYQIQPIPTTYMVDSNGMIQFKTYGAMNYDSMVAEYEKME